MELLLVGDIVVYNPPYIIASDIWFRNRGNQYVVVEVPTNCSEDTSIRVTEIRYRNFSLEEIPIQYVYKIRRRAFLLASRREPDWIL